MVATTVHRKVVKYQPINFRSYSMRRFGAVQVWAVFLVSFATTLPAQRATSRPWVDRWLVPSDGVGLHVLSGGSGTGPTIVFVPGWTMPADIWEPQLRYFVRSARVVALDPRSQGSSQRTPDGNYTDRRAQDIHELIAHIKAPRVVLVGWSMGVPEALELVKQFGTQDIAGLVLVDNFVYIPPSSPVATFIDTLLFHVLRDRPAFTASFARGMYRAPQGSAYIAGLTALSPSTPTATAYTLLACTLGTPSSDWRTVFVTGDRRMLFVIR